MARIAKSQAKTPCLGLRYDVSPELGEVAQRNGMGLCLLAGLDTFRR